MSGQSEARNNTCPVCGGGISAWRSKAVGEDTYLIDACTVCGYAFVNPRPSIGFLMDFYSVGGHGHDLGPGELLTLDQILQSEDLNPNSTVDARRIISTVGKLNEGVEPGEFLDVGCGYGFFSKAAISAGYEVTALDMASHERQIAQQLTGLHAIPTSFEDYPGKDGNFQIVLLSQILEHAHDVNLWVEKARRLLEDRGLLVIALPNFGSITRKIMQEKEPLVSPPAHLNFFSKGSLSTLLNKHGFGVEEVQWISRIPSTALESRLPPSLKPLLPVAHAAANGVLSIADATHLGTFINVYARKS